MKDKPGIAKVYYIDYKQITQLLIARPLPGYCPVLPDHCPTSFAGLRKIIVQTLSIIAPSLPIISPFLPINIL